MTYVNKDLPVIGVTMVRDSVRDFPVYRLPDGYRLRMYRDGDAETWTALQMAAEPFIKVTPELFVREYGDALDALPDRMFFVETLDGEPAGSISAWWEKERHNPLERGRIHWVVVHPDHQRRGLTKPMMTAAMERLAQSHRAAMLGTHASRPWAVKVYLDFGFVPDREEIETNPEIAAAWRALQGVIQHPTLAQALVGG